MKKGEKYTMRDKSGKSTKRLSLFLLSIIFMLCVAVVLHAEHIGTVLNNKVASASFDDIINHASEKQARDDDFEMPTDWWLDGHWASDFDGGTGDFHDPYLISTPEQLALMAFLINSSFDSRNLTASYQLTADIDMSAHFWAPMGRWENDRAFRGVFDGGSHEIGSDGKDHGTVHVISGLVMRNHWDYSNGTIVGFFGVLGDQAVITNVIFDNSISYLDPEIQTSERATLAIVASQVQVYATVSFENMAVYNSATFTPQTLLPDGEDGLDFIGGEIKSGIIVGWQEGVDGDEHPDIWNEDKKPGKIYMSDAHVRMSSVLINIYLDLAGWDMSPDIVINSFGGLMGEARYVDIQNSSYEGVIGVEVVRRDRNMDNAQFIYVAGGAVGLMDAYNGSTSYFNNVDLSGSIYLDTFKNENDGFNRNVATAQDVSKRTNTASYSNVNRYKNNREVEWVSDVREIGGIFGDANIWGQGNINLTDVTASFFVDAPKGNNISLGDKQSKAIQDSKNPSPDQQAAINRAKDDAKDKATLTGRHAFISHEKSTRDDLEGPGDGGEGPGGLEGPPKGPAGPILFSVVAPILVGAITYGIAFGLDAALMAMSITLTMAIGVSIVVAVAIVILAIVVFAVLFAFWGAQKPKWESQVYVGSAIGSEGRKGIIFNNVHTANAVISSDTMYSKNEAAAQKTDSHHTTPTLGMITSQPEAPKSSTIGDKVHLEVSGKGTVMSDGSMGVDSVLEYQWYYNTIDSNNILDGTEQGLGGAKTVKVEGATMPSLDINVDYLGSRYYFVKQINHVIEFRGNVNSVTARIGSKTPSIQPAKITEQPKDIGINTSAVGVLNVVAEATGDIDYQWYFSDDDINDPTKASLVMGGDKSELKVVHNTSGVKYYFVVVGVTLSFPDGSKVISYTSSHTARVTVSAGANDFDILSISKDTTVSQYDNTILGVTINLTQINGNLSYQWYRADSANGEGELLKGETYQSVVVDTDTPRDVWYYVVVTNTVENVSKSVTSNRSKVTIKESEKVEANIIDSNENNADIMVGDGHNFKISATAEATIKYQWYRTTTPGNTDGIALEGGSNPNYYVQANYAGTQYYYATVTTYTPKGGVNSQKSKVYTLNIEDDNLRDLELETMRPKEEIEGDIKYTTIGIMPVNRPGSTTYQWYGSNNTDGENAVELKGENSNTLRVGNSENHYFYVEVTNVVDIEVLVPDKNDGSTKIETFIKTATSDIMHVEPNIVIPTPPPTIPKPTPPGQDGSKFWVEVGITGGSIAALVVIALLILSAMKATTLKRRPQRASSSSRLLNKSGSKNLNNTTTKNTRNQTNNKPSRVDEILSNQRYQRYLDKNNLSQNSTNRK